MQVAILYGLVVLIWGTTWIGIAFQLGPVAEELSVAYRFGLASVALFVYAWLSKRQIRIPRALYPMVVLQGAVLFCANYMLVYYGTNYITTGLVAVVFSLIVLTNAFFERVFFGTLLESRLMAGALLGIAGVALIFWPEVSRLSLQDRTVVGVAIVTAGVVVASIGNMTAVLNTSRHLPVVAVNAHAMAWGSLISFTVALILGREITFSFAPGYVISLLYLAWFGSAIAFGAYLALIRKIGSARAAYCSVLFPVVALLISTVFEDYRWSTTAVIGVGLILAGNWLALSRAIRGLDHTTINRNRQGINSDGRT
jgi:drug/metabolite transporter (DMT)-like permease